MKSNFLTLLLILMGFALNAQCDCELDPNDTPVCVQDSSGQYFQLPNACFAECFGFSILPDSLCSGGGWSGGCNCTIDPTEPFICTQDSIGNYYEMPNACFAACFGLTVVSDSLCTNGGWNGDCGCTIDPNEPYVCAQDSSGAYFEVPNACYAACWGYSVVSDSLCTGGGWNGDCGCTFDPNEPYVCAQDSLGTYFEVPNACYAACWGYTVVSDSLCTGGGGWNGDCGCTIDSTEAYICVQDSIGNVFQVPNQCYATCWGLTVVSDSLCNFGVEPWGECDCEIDLEAPFLCAVDSLGHPCYVPNECFAACLGLTIVGDSICDLDSTVIYQDSFTLCLETISASNFQEFILAAHNTCGMEVPQCILDAPLFNNDSLFFEYIIGNCGDLTGGGNIMNIYNSFSTRALASKDLKIDAYDVKLMQNPVHDNLDFTINAKSQSNVFVSILDINGQVKNQRKENLNSGENRMKLDVSTLNGGMYLLSIRDKDAIKTLKFVKQ